MSDHILSLSDTKFKRHKKKALPSFMKPLRENVRMEDVMKTSTLKYLISIVIGSPNAKVMKLTNQKNC